MAPVSLQRTPNLCSRISEWRPGRRLSEVRNQMEILQNLGTMPPCGSTTEIIAGKLIDTDSELFCQIFSSVRWNLRTVICEKAAGAKILQLRSRTKLCYRRFGIDEINVGETQAPLTEKIRTRNTRTQYYAPKSVCNVTKRPVAGQSRRPCSHNVLRVGQFRSFGPTGPIP